MKVRRVSRVMLKVRGKIGLHRCAECRDTRKTEVRVKEKNNQRGWDVLEIRRKVRTSCMIRSDGNMEVWWVYRKRGTVLG